MHPPRYPLNYPLIHPPTQISMHPPSQLTMHPPTKLTTHLPTQLSLNLSVHSPIEPEKAQRHGRGHVTRVFVRPCTLWMTGRKRWRRRQTKSRKRWSSIGEMGRWWVRERVHWVETSIMETARGLGKWPQEKNKQTNKTSIDRLTTDTSRPTRPAL